MTVAWRGISLALLALACGGCNVIGLVANAAGPPAIEPQFVPGREPMLILCENFQNPGATYVEAEQLEQYLAHEIRLHDIAPLIEPGQLADLRAARASEFTSMSVAQIGRAVGATQVLYVHMERSTIDVAESSEMYKGSGAARAKLIDAQTGQVLWPTDTPAGRYVAAETPLLRAGENVTAASVRQGIQRALATQIVRFFYKYKPE